MSFTWDVAKKQLRNPYTFPGYDKLSDIRTDNIDTNDTIKPIDREDANSELEKKEYVLQPTGNLYKVLGNTHKAGGTPVKLPSGSFVYSNHKPLAISKDDKELFEFKNGGTYKPLNNTPANILKREIDTKHHNNMIAIMGSNDHDNISKKSAALMLKKNFKKLGQIAYLQEEKKGFPEGIPTFSQNTAPVQTDASKNADVLQKQYKLGGLTKYQDGSFTGDYNDVIGKSTLVDTVPPNAKKLFTMGPRSTYYSLDGEGNVNLNTGNYAPQDAEKYISQLAPGNATYEDRVAAKHFLDTPRNKQLWQKYNGKFGTTSYLQTRTPSDYEMAPISTDNSGYPDVSMKPVPNKPGLSTPFFNTPGDTPTDDEGNILPYDPRVPFSSWQKANIGYAAFNAATIGKYFPKRAQVNFDPVTLERINPQPYLNQLSSQENRGYALNQTLNPILARSNNSEIFGSGLDKSSEILGNIDNQNKQISNQENLYNNQGSNNAANQNVQLDQNYYDAVQRTNQNYERESRIARNQIVSVANNYKSSNDELQNELASQPTFGSRDVYKDPVTGRIYTDINQVPGRLKGRVIKAKQASPIYDYNARNNSIYYTGAGIDLNALPDNSNRMTDVVQLAKMLMDSGADSKEAFRTAAYWLKNNK